MADATTLQGGWDGGERGGLQPSVTLATCLGQWLLRSVVSDAGAGLPQHVEAPREESFPRVGSRDEVYAQLGRFQRGRISRLFQPYTTPPASHSRFVVCFQHLPWTQWDRRVRESNWSYTKIYVQNWL